jgi:hypothetical protein
MISTLLAVLLAPQSFCHTTVIIKLDHNYTNNQINKIVDFVLPSSTFVICGMKITEGRKSVEVRYGAQKGKLS